MPHSAAPCRGWADDGGAESPARFSAAQACPPRPRGHRLSPHRGDGPHGAGAIAAVAPSCRLPQRAASPPRAVGLPRVAAPPPPPPPPPPGGGAAKALLVGVSYSGTDLEAPGAVESVHEVGQWLLAAGFLAHGVPCRRLLEGSADPPTRLSILCALRWLVRGAAPGDSLFLLLCGRSGRAVPEQSLGDDGLEMGESLLPSDWQSEGPLHSDQLWDILVGGLAGGARLTVVVDVAGAGALVPLPYQATVHGRMLSHGGSDLDDPANSEIPAHVVALGVERGHRHNPGDVSAAAVLAARRMSSLPSTEDLTLRTAAALRQALGSTCPPVQVCSSRPLSQEQCCFSLFALPPAAPPENSADAGQRLKKRVQQLERELKQTQPQQRGALCARLDERAAAGAPSCPGAARAVLIGCGDDTGGAAAGARSMLQLLMEQGYDARARLLTDDATAEHLLPTHGNLIGSLRWLCEGTEAGEALFLHFSGHSAAVSAGAPAGGMAPSDWTSRGAVLADEASDLLLPHLPAGSCLHCVCDLAEGGCALDLPYRAWLSPDGTLTTAHAGRGRAADGGRVTAKLQGTPEGSGARIIAVCACGADEGGGGTPQPGALTDALIASLQRASEPCVSDLLALLAEHLQGRARPMLCASFAVQEHDVWHLGSRPRPALHVAAGVAAPASPRHWAKQADEPAADVVADSDGEDEPPVGSRVRHQTDARLGIVVAADAAAQQITVQWDDGDSSEHRWGADEEAGGGAEDVVLLSDGLSPRRKPPVAHGATKALLVLMRYSGQQCELPSGDGYHRQLRRFVADVGFADTRVISDDPTLAAESFAPPTRSGLLKGMLWLVQSALPGDALLLHFVGHGAAVEGRHRAERGGGGLAMVDWQTAGLATEDDLARCLLPPLPPAARLTAVLDVAGGGGMTLPHALDLDATGCFNWSSTGHAAPVQCDADVVAVQMRRAGDAAAEVVVPPPGALTVGLMMALATAAEPAVVPLLTSLHEAAQQFGASGVVPSLRASAPCDVLRFGAVASGLPAAARSPVCTRAVVVGISYRGGEDGAAEAAPEISHAPKAARATAALLAQLGFSDRAIRVMTDDSGGAGGAPLWPPTRANILRSMAWLVRGAQPGDALCWAFVGHGDLKGGSGAGMAPTDWSDAGIVTAADAAQKLLRKLPPGVRLTLIADVAGGGSVIELPNRLEGGGMLGLQLHNAVTPPVRGHAMALHCRTGGHAAGSLSAAVASVLMAQRPSCAQVLANVSGLLRRQDASAAPVLSSSLRIDPSAPFYLFPTAPPQRLAIAAPTPQPLQTVVPLPPSTRITPKASDAARRRAAAAGLSPPRTDRPRPPAVVQPAAGRPAVQRTECSPPRRRPESLGRTTQRQRWAEPAQAGGSTPRRSRWQQGPVSFPRVGADSVNAAARPKSSPPRSHSDLSAGSSATSSRRGAQLRRVRLPAPSAALGVVLHPRGRRGAAGMVVASVTAGSPAAAAGLSAGDVVLSMQGHLTDTAEAVAAACAAATFRADTVIDVVILPAAAQPEAVGPPSLPS